jgi:hypothetical protein
MEQQELDIQAVLKALREIIGNQAQQIAILTATIEASNTQP